MRDRYSDDTDTLALNKCISIITVWYQVVTAEECSFTSVRYMVINSASANDLLSQCHIQGFTFLA